MSLVDAREFVGALDYSQFSLETTDDAWEGLPDLIDRITSQNARIGQDGGALLVLTPHQWNFELPLRRELHDAHPAEDVEHWDEVYDATLEVGGYGLWFSSPTMDTVDLRVPPEQYRVRWSGRGFGWNPATPENEQWRVQLWPEPVAIEPRSVKLWRPSGGGGPWSSAV